MFCRDIKFDKRKDLHEVEQFGFVDLKSALVSGVVPSDLNGPEVSSNMIDSPEGILGKPDDIFSAYRMQSAINDYATAKEEESSSSQDS